MLSKIDVDHLMARVASEVVGAGTTEIKAVMFDVMKEFLNDSSAWTEDVSISATPSVTEYPVVPTEGQIVSLVGVSDADGNFIPALMEDVGTVVLQAAPNITLQYIARVKKTVGLPTTTKDQFPIGPDWLLPLWGLYIWEGICGRMMSSPSKSYYNKEVGFFHLKRFRDGIAQARYRKLHANTNGAVNWRFPQSFRTSSQRGGVPSFGGVGERTF